MELILVFLAILANMIGWIIAIGIVVLAFCVATGLWALGITVGLMIGVIAALVQLFTQLFKHRKK